MRKSSVADSREAGSPLPSVATRARRGRRDGHRRGLPPRDSHWARLRARFWKRPPPSSAPTLAREPKGSKGSGALPLPVRNVQRCVGWLSHLSVAKPDRRCRRENASPGTARNSVHRGVASSSTALRSPVSLAARAYPRALLRAVAFRPTSNPSGTRDRRSWVILRPAGYPKTALEPAETASEASMEERRLRNTRNAMLTGPAPLSRWSVPGVDGV